MKRIALFFAAALLMVACNNRQNDAILKKSSSGKTLEVLVAADKGRLSKTTRDVIDSVLRQPQGCLPQPEARFDVVSVPVSSLRNTHMFQMHRNIIILEVKDGNPDKVYIDRDKWAEPQVVVDIAASSEESLRDLLCKYEPNIVQAIYDAEHKRMQKAFYNVRNVDLMNRVKEKFGFELTFSEDFMWASVFSGNSLLFGLAHFCIFNCFFYLFALLELFLFFIAHDILRAKICLSGHQSSSSSGEGWNFIRSTYQSAPVTHTEE